MKDTTNVTIVLLSVSACILAGMLILANVPQPAYAVGSVRGGDYIMVNGSVSSGVDLLYIVDLGQQKLNVYVVDAVQNQIYLKDQLNLRVEFRQ
jgi:hypothetical protein